MKFAILRTPVQLVILYEYAILNAVEPGTEPMKGVPTATHNIAPERSAPYATPLTELKSVVLDPTTAVQSMPLDEYASVLAEASALPPSIHPSPHLFHYSRT